MERRHRHTLVEVWNDEGTQTRKKYGLNGGDCKEDVNVPQKGRFWYVVDKCPDATQVLLECFGRRGEDAKMLWEYSVSDLASK